MAKKARPRLTPDSVSTHRHAVEWLEEFLQDYPSAYVIISHDRYFLDRLATHIMAFEGDSQVVFFEGNFQAYEEDKHKRMGTEADKVHRIKYRKLTM